MPTPTHPTLAAPAALLLLLLGAAGLLVPAVALGGSAITPSATTTSTNTPPSFRPLPRTTRTRSVQECAGDGDRSKQCGADADGTRPEFCCEGHVCSDKGVQCALLATTTADDADGADDAAGGGGGGGGGGAVVAGGSGSGIYQDGPITVGDIVVEGTSQSSTVEFTNLQIDLPSGATPKAFLFMFMGDTSGPTGERVAYHDNWDHLLDVPSSNDSNLNLKVQHKVWSGNRNFFKVWDGEQKVVVMPSFLGVDTESPIVDSAAVRFADTDSPTAPSVNAVDGGAVVVVYYFDDAANIVDHPDPDDASSPYSVLASDATLAGNSVSTFAAATVDGCTGPVTVSAAAARSGIAFAVSLRPEGGSINDLEDCAAAVDDGPSTPDGATATWPVQYGDLDVCTGPDGLCQLCEGDCDSDDECAEGLVCFRRSGNEGVPGCAGKAVDGEDYCHDPDFTEEGTGGGGDGSAEPTTEEPTLEPTEEPIGEPTVEPTLEPTEEEEGGDGDGGAPSSPGIEFGDLGDCTGTDGLCLECEGSCGSDADCAMGLVCAKRDGNENVEGCTGDNAVYAKNYCYEPVDGGTAAPPPTVVDEEYVYLSGTGTEFSPIGQCDGVDGTCLECQGDCNSDDDCVFGFLCYGRFGDDAVPGCHGLAATSMDYCIREDNVPVDTLADGQTPPPPGATSGGGAQSPTMLAAVAAVSAAAVLALGSGLSLA